MNKYIASDLIESAKKLKVGQSRRPLRSHKELCQEFGVSSATLSGYLRQEGAPKPILKHKSSGNYYDHPEVYKWWSGLQK